VEAKLLQVTIYMADGWTWHTEQIRNPTWNDVDAAVRRLDRFHYPFVWLYRTADPEEGMPPFGVTGGEGGVCHGLDRGQQQRLLPLLRLIARGRNDRNLE
jgi:hypothetical protein